MAAWLCGLAGMLSLPVVAQEASAGDTETTIRALESRWITAQAHHDSGSLSLIFDNDLVYIEYGRLLSKSEYLSRIESQKGAAEQQMVVEAMTVQQFGDAAIVIGTYREQKAAAGKASTRRWRFEDTWVYEDRRWMLAAAGASPMAK